MTLELRDAGFTQVYSLRGGLDAWLAVGGSVEPKEEETIIPDPPQKDAD